VRAELGVEEGGGEGRMRVGLKLNEDGRSAYL